MSFVNSALASPEDFVPGIQGPADPSDDSLVFAFRERRLLVHWDDGGARVPTLRELRPLLESTPPLFLGTLSGAPVLTCGLPDEVEVADGMALKGLRGLFGRLGDPHFALAGRGVQIVDWDRDHRFCGRCAEPTEASPAERTRRCPRCGLSCYPRLAPAVIVAVDRGDEILLARSSHFPPGMYSTLAGFSEPGESLEETVLREIEEESGILVTNIRYFGSQPWPFPHSLMVGFRAQWASGDIVLEDPEIEAADWFRPDAMPKIPPRISIARALIEDFLAEQGRR